MAEPCPPPAAARSDASGTISGGHRASPVPRPPGQTAVPKPRGCTVEALVGPARSGSVSPASGAFCLCPTPSGLVSKSPELCLTNDSKSEPLVISDHVPPSAGPRLLAMSDTPLCQGRAGKQQEDRDHCKRLHSNPEVKAEPAGGCTETTTSSNEKHLP